TRSGELDAFPGADSNPEEWDGYGVVDTMVQQPDGRIVVGGIFSSVGGVPRDSLARLTPEGAVDSLTSPVSLESLPILALQQDGKILLATWADDGPVYALHLDRLYPDGTPDADVAQT